MKKYLTNAKVFSFNDEYYFADTVEIDNGIIKRIGSKKEILPVDNKKGHISDLRGSLLIPGFTDSHIHLLAYGQSLQRVDTHTGTKQECLDRINARVETTPPGKWIIGHGWDHNIWKCGYGSKDDLDQISTDHPIYLTHKSLHSGWANSRALRKAGIRKDTDNPQGGNIIRFENGNPNGILIENAMRLVETVIPDPDEREIFAAINSAQKALNRFGITCVHDFDPWKVYSVLKILQDNSDLSIRVHKGIPTTSLENAINYGMRSGEGDDWIRIGCLKLFADGALGPQTAAMLAPYENSNSTGMLLLDKNAIVAIGEKAMMHKIAMAVHAIGDRANREVLMAYKYLNEQKLLSIPSIPSRIEHVQIIDKEDLRHFSENNIISSMQPIHAISDMDMADEHWGERSARSYAWKSVIDSGARLIFGSDAPVETPNPFFGIYAAITRKKIRYHSGIGWTANECIGINDAIKAYCCNPSISTNTYSSTGRIDAGKKADIVILPRNFLMFAPNDIRDTLPFATMVNGNWVFKNDKIDIEFN